MRTSERRRLTFEFDPEETYGTKDNGDPKALGAADIHIAVWALEGFKQSSDAVRKTTSFFASSFSPSFGSRAYTGNTRGSLPGADIIRIYRKLVSAVPLYAFALRPDIGCVSGYQATSRPFSSRTSASSAIFGQTLVRM